MMMMKSCENCALFLNGCPELDGCDFENCGYKPDCKTLEAENAGLKQELEVYKTAFDNLGMYLAASCGICESLKDELLEQARKELAK